jgi:hypothetical protein
MATIILVSLIAVAVLVLGAVLMAGDVMTD